MATKRQRALDMMDGAESELDWLRGKLAQLLVDALRDPDDARAALNTVVIQRWCGEYEILSRLIDDA